MAQRIFMVFMEFFAFFVSNYPFGLLPGRRHDTTGALLIP